MKVLYFSWLRERVGVASEDVETEAATARELIVELVARGEHYAHAFKELGTIRVAVDQEMADMNAPLGGAREVAFFPPVTGG
ncbi:MAG: molybdopterin converting factor subunit 1 [Pseudomonadota bacterium]